MGLNGRAVPALEGGALRIATIERNGGRSELRLSLQEDGRLELREWRLLDGAWWPGEGIDVEPDEMLLFLRGVTDVAERFPKIGGRK